MPLSLDGSSGITGAINVQSTGSVLAGVTTVSAGSASAPSISPTGDSNTGIFFPAADTVAIAEGGTEVLRIDSTGSTLINTTVQATSNGGLSIATNSNGSTATTLGLQNRSTGNNSGVYISHRGLTNVGAEADYNYIEMVADNTTSKTGSIRFHTVSGGGPAERARITSTGNVQIANGNLVFSTAGTGIDFSAYSNAAGMTSELLNDYEEGTWTPSISNAYNSPPTVSYTTQSGSYTKIGRLVVAAFHIEVSAFSGGGGPIFFSGLPFNPASTDSRFQGTVYISGPNTPTSTVTVNIGYAKLDNGNYYITFNCPRDDTAMANAGTITTSDISANDVIGGTYTYFV